MNLFVIEKKIEMDISYDFQNDFSSNDWFFFIQRNESDLKIL